MRKKLMILILLAAVCAVGGITLSYNNRTASNLSAYCHIDFRGLPDPAAHKVDDASLALTDFRFFASPLEDTLTIDIDGKRYRLPAEVSYRPPTLSPADFQQERCFKHTNSLFLHFSPAILREIQTAQSVNIAFQYTGSAKPIELPLSEADLMYWKNQLKFPA